MSAFSSTVRRGGLSLMRVADWLVVLIAVALPWSLTGTAICIVAWLVAVLPTLNLASVRRELESAAGGLPVLLWCLAVIGMLWADVSWTERFGGLGSFHRLLVIPLLMAQFRRTKNGMPVIYGFLISSGLALIATYVLTLTPGLTWRGPKGDGIAAHDDIFQGSVAVICGFGALGYAAINAAKRHWQAALISTALAAIFLSYLLFVSIFSRIVLGVAPVLTILLGWRFGRLKGLILAWLVAAAVSVAFWVVSPVLRERVYKSIDEMTEYSATNKATSIGQHLAFLTESLTIISSAPLFGHGTGSIAKEFLKVTAGKRGASAVPTVNPHNQTFAIAIQIGLLGAIVLWWMWIAHFLLFRGGGNIAWFGTLIVIENMVSSTVHTHLFDSVHGWLYVFGVGVLGGMVLHKRMIGPKRGHEADDESYSIIARPDRHGRD